MIFMPSAIFQIFKIFPQTNSFWFATLSDSLWLQQLRCVMETILIVVRIKQDMDTNAQNRSRAYATGPDFRLNYLFLRCRGTGPIFVWKQFLTIDIHVSSLKLSQLTMGLDPYCPQINISRVKMSFLELVLLLVQLHSWLLPDGRCKYDKKNHGTGPKLS